MAYIAVDKKGIKVKIFVISQQNIRFGYSLEAPPRVSTTVALVERGYPHIIFLISARKHMLYVLIRSASPFLFLHESICCGYLLERIGEALLMSTHNIYFRAEMRKMSVLCFDKKKCLI